MTGTQADHDLPGHRHLASAGRLPGARRLRRSLTKALREMRPEQVTKEVTASGILGHGGAAFPAGRKWGVIKLNDGQPHFLCANADEGEPGTFKDRWILENAPHLLLESMLIAAYALQVRHAFVYIRGEFDLPYRRLAAAVEEAYEAGYFGERILGTDFALRHRDLPRRRLLRLWRSLGPDHLDRGQEGLPSQPPAAPDGARPVPAAHGDQQRRDAGQRDRHRGPGRRGLPQGRHGQEPGTQLVSISGHVERPGVYEVEYGYPLAKFIYEDCGGVLGGGKLKCIVPGGISTKVLTAAEIETVTYDHASLTAAGSGVAGRHGRHRRGDLHGAPAADPAALLSP